MNLRSDIASAAREMTSSDRVARELRQLGARLREGEVVHRVAAGVFGTGYGLLAVTDQRVVLLRDGRSGQASRGFALNRLMVADWAPGEVAGTITMADADGGVELGQVAAAEGEQIVEFVRSRMASPVLDPPQPAALPRHRPPPDRRDLPGDVLDCESRDERTQAANGGPHSDPCGGRDTTGEQLDAPPGPPPVTFLHEDTGGPVSAGGRHTLGEVDGYAPGSGPWHAVSEPDATTYGPSAVPALPGVPTPALPAHGGPPIGAPVNNGREPPTLRPPVPDAARRREQRPRSAQRWTGTAVGAPNTSPGSQASEHTVTSRGHRSSRHHRGGGSMSRGDWLVIATAVVCVLVGVGGYALVSPQSVRSLLADSSTQPNDVRPPAIAAPPASDDAHAVVRVSRVIDAHSIEVSGPVSGPVQVLGIVAPAGSQCHAGESTAYAVRTLLGTSVTLTYDPAQPAADRSGPRQGNVTLAGGADYAVLAAGAGAVKYSLADPPAAKADQIEAAETDAQRANKGLWGAPCYGSFTATDNTATDNTADDNTAPDSTALDSTAPDSAAPDSAATDLTGAGGGGGFEGAHASRGVRSGTGPRSSQPGSRPSTSQSDGSSQRASGLGSRLYPEHPPVPERIVPPGLGGP